ncbi:hypothetical protein [Lihuaxuella thermophila]|uniref:Alanine dehydrogenase n=1 Tax=Lihuaxuella thermophila TaxID=1173111 RepID=A0A1H8J185_9BACL|nr:hypothetical protein [Lihuaxuella thermophila]SEN74643.1 alanine dehydrogenase [Lihuaxuella thermophila]
MEAQKNNKSISVLKETKDDEKRVILMPDQVKLFVQAGYQVYVETGAGNGSGFSDDEYREAGAEIVSTSEAWLASPFVVKFKSPGPHEYHFLHQKMHIGAFFHAEGNPELTKVLCDSGVTAYAFEFFRTTDGFFPMSFADSEIAGKILMPPISPDNYATF